MSDRRPRIGILDDTLDLALRLADWSPVADRAELVAIHHHIDPVAAPAELADFDALCTLRERLPFPRGLLERLPRLRHLCVTGKRYDTVDIAAAAELGITVTNTPVLGRGAGAVTELTWGLILGLARGIATEGQGMRAGGWQTRAGLTLRGKRLGVVGLGAIGADVARIGLAFGMEVCAWSPNLTAERAASHGVRAVDKATLFAGSDVVTLHLALASATTAIVGRAEFAAMREGAFLVNTARAGLIDTGAMIDALGQARIGGVALDVFDIEPLPADDVLRRFDNALLTPHLGYVTRDMLATYYGFAVENLAAHLDGVPIRVVTPHAA